MNRKLIGNRYVVYYSK